MSVNQILLNQLLRSSMLGFFLFVCLSKRAKRNEREYLNDGHPKKPNQSADQIFCL